MRQWAPSGETQSGFAVHPESISSIAANLDIILIFAEFVLGKDKNLRRDSGTGATEIYTVMRHLVGFDSLFEKMRISESQSQGTVIGAFGHEDFENFCDFTAWLKEIMPVRWGLDRADVWDSYIRPGFTFVVVPNFKGEGVIGAILDADKRPIKASDNEDRPLDSEKDMAIIRKYIGGPAGQGEYAWTDYIRQAADSFNRFKARLKLARFLASGAQEE